MGKVFKLRNYESEWGESPGDRLVFFRTGTLAAGSIEVDLSKEIEKGEAVYAFPLVKYTTDSSTGKITVTNSVGSTDAVEVMIVAESNILAPVSQMFGG